jgi:hypothetical protein
MIEFKGIRDGLLINVNEKDWHVAQSKLLQYLDEQLDFLKGANLILSLGDLTLKAADLGLLRDQISERGLTLSTVLTTSSQTEQTAQALGIATSIENTNPSQEQMPNISSLTTSILGEDAILIRRKHFVLE